MQIVRPTKLLIENSYPIENSPQKIDDKENRLKQWQDRLKGTDLSPSRNIRNRNYTGIDQEDVRNALRIAKQQKDDTNNKRISKLKEHDNDEGFEESQSLKSESPSQGASSDLIDSGEFGNKGNRPVRTSSLESKCTVDSTSASSTTETPSKPKRTTDKPVSRVQSDRMQSLISRYRQPVERSTSIKNSLQHEDSKKSIIPRRSMNIQKTDSQNSITNKNGNNVERSGSRASLLSSRSSLNSAVSTNTIKKMPLKTIGNQKSAGKTIPVSSTRKPLSPANSQIKSTVTIKRVPSGQTLVNQKPPLRNSNLSFMKPTTSSTTKTHTPSTAPTGRLLSFRPNK